MKRMPRIKDVMTAFPFSIEDTASMAQAKAMMKEHKVGHLPVKLSDGSLSVLSKREFERIELPGHSHTDFEDLIVSDLCPNNVYTVDLYTSLIEVLDYMSDAHADCVLVTRHDKLAGVFTFSDACHAYSEALKEEFFPGGGNSVA
ncbi:MAG: CBS domain-containing protein [Gammaproteobacteria bacterium]|nr:CBS domain-containing protein [Gammaproteobacteria bacterium]